MFNRIRQFMLLFLLPIMLACGGSVSYASTIQYAESETTSRTTNTAFQTKTTLTFTPEVAGDYLIYATAEYTADSIGRSAYIRLQEDNTTDIGTANSEPDEQDIFFKMSFLKQFLKINISSMDK
jgi:hypothetical protein